MTLARFAAAEGANALVETLARGLLPSPYTLRLDWGRGRGFCPSLRVPTGWGVHAKCERGEAWRSGERSSRRKGEE